MLLVGDIGGTKTELAVVSRETGPTTWLARDVFPSARYDGLVSIVEEFLRRGRFPIESACFAVAGPVIDGVAHTTNLPWLLDELQLASRLGLRAVRLMNDLEALALAIPLLEPSDRHSLSPGQLDPSGTIAVIAPGTGLGEAFLTWDGARYQAQPSEGGHADFAPLTPLQASLLQYLQARLGHVSYEQVCSGIGIPNIYDYLRDSGAGREDASLAEELRAAGDRSPVIAGAALRDQDPDPLCVLTIATFVEILAAEAGNLALKLLATGGVYIGGGIPARILPLISAERFMATFTAKGRLSQLLQRIPVHVILRPVNLDGVAAYAIERETEASAG